jgi:hypothetical protein
METPTPTPTPKKRKYQGVSNKVKKEILERLDKGERSSDLAAKYNIDISTISYYKKNREKIMQAADEASSTKISFCPALDTCVYEWWKLQRSRKLTVSQLMLMEKAREFAEQMKQQFPRLVDFKASTGWMTKFLVRHPDCKQISLYGEGGSVNETDADAERKKLQGELVKWPKQNIFNCDETALFYRMLPTETLGSGGDKGTKADKSRVTVLFCVNADGSEKLKPLIIGKYKNPRALNKINRSNLSCQYTNSPKAWMNGTLFSSWLIDWNAKLKFANRKILLISDNVSSHTNIDVTPLTNITLLYLPPNFTSHLQPLDAGVIRSFKAHFRRLMVRFLIKGYDEKNTMPVLNVKNAIDLTGDAWKLVSAATIQNCWKHTRIYPTLEAMNDTALNEIDDVMKDLQEALNAIRPQLSQSISAEDSVDCDAKEPIEGAIGDDMIIENALSTNGELERKDADSDDENEPEPVAAKDAMAAAKKLISFLEQNIPDSAVQIEQLKAVLNLAEAKRVNGFIQQSIHQYFSQ